jgi:hypothetical protein
LFDTFYTPSSAYGYTGGIGVITGAAPGNIMASPNIKWEATVSQNVGIDFTLFNKRVYGALDGYITDTKDLLLLAKIPQTSGYEYQYQNSGKLKIKVSNSVWELLSLVMKTLPGKLISTSLLTKMS